MFDRIAHDCALGLRHGDVHVGEVAGGGVPPQVAMSFLVTHSSPLVQQQGGPHSASS